MPTNAPCLAMARCTFSGVQFVAVTVEPSLKRKAHHNSGGAALHSSILLSSRGRLADKAPMFHNFALHLHAVEPPGARSVPVLELKPVEHILCLLCFCPVVTAVTRSYKQRVTAESRSTSGFAACGYTLHAVFKRPIFLETHAYSGFWACMSPEYIRLRGAGNWCNCVTG